jgi:hypothetical protein
MDFEKMTRRCFFLLVFVVAASGANAMRIYHMTSDGITTPTLGPHVFAAEGRIGGPSTYELDLGPEVGAPETKTEFSWPKSKTVPFRLVYEKKKNLLTYFVGRETAGLTSTTLTYHPSGSRFTDFYIRAYAKKPGSSITVNNIVVNGVPIGELCKASQPYPLDIIHVADVNLFEGFTLTGDVTMDWLEGQKPTESELIFQIVGGVEPIPEPATAALVGVGLTGLEIARRRRKKRFSKTPRS